MFTDTQPPRVFDLGQTAWVDGHGQAQRWHHSENTNEDVQRCWQWASVRTPSKGKPNCFCYLREHLDVERQWRSRRRPHISGKINTVYLYSSYCIKNSRPLPPLMKPFAQMFSLCAPKDCNFKRLKCSQVTWLERKKKQSNGVDAAYPFSPWEHVPLVFL